MTSSTLSKAYDERFKLYPPYETTPMKAMYQRVARMIPRSAPVTDMGCGNGYLASALKEAGYQGQYDGFDFSTVAIEMAKAALQPAQETLWPVTPQYIFAIGNLDYFDPFVDDQTHRTVYTCFEVLEHYPRDVELVERLPARSRFIFSVPNFWSATHIRTYDKAGSAMKRYGHVLRFDSWQLFYTQQPEAGIFVFDTHRRADTW